MRPYLHSCHHQSPVAEYSHCITASRCLVTECCSGLGLSKEAARVDYLLGFPLLPPEPLRLRAQVPERDHGAGAELRVITASAR